MSRYDNCSREELLRRIEELEAQLDTPKGSGSRFRERYACKILDSIPDMLTVLDRDGTLVELVSADETNHVGVPGGELAGQNIRSRRFSLVRAHTGAEAVDMFGTVQPDAVLMDIRMPVMDGLEATRRIRSVSADVPIIAMSAYSSGSEIESARNAGCNEFLVKPLSQYSLHRALNAALVEFKGKGKS